MNDSNPGSVLAIAYAASVGGMGTLIGTPPEFHHGAVSGGAGRASSFDFVQWMGRRRPDGAGPSSSSSGLVLEWLAPPPPADPERHASIELPVVAWRNRHGGLLRARGGGLDGAGHSCERVGAPHAEAGREAPCPSGPSPFSRPRRSSLIMDTRTEKPRSCLGTTRRVSTGGSFFLFGGGLSLGAQMFDTGLAAEIGPLVSCSVTGITSLLGTDGTALVFIHRVLHRGVLQHCVVQHDRAARNRCRGRARRVPASTCACCGPRPRAARSCFRSQRDPTRSHTERD